MERQENNKAQLSGKIVSEMKYDHEVCWEKFYFTTICVERMSGATDLIPILISEKIFENDLNGEYVSVTGRFSSYNKEESGKKHLVLYFFVDEILILDTASVQFVNDIELTGYLCKQPIYRKTPLGREISNLLLAVNRTYGRSDFIPCICWGRNARFASRLNASDNIKICGRMQSREYQKKINDTDYETRIAYEVSISKMEVIKDEED